MTGDPLQSSTQDESCANCDAPLSGDFCAACGQSREDIKRPALSLITDTLDGLLSWDGRILSTFRALYTRPGRVARDYMDGKRQSYTPPIRLYLIVSLIFFAAMTVSGVRIVGVDIITDAEGDTRVMATLFQPPREGEPVRLDAEEQVAVLASAIDQGVEQRWQDLAARAMQNPDSVEQQASAAASQALILMVIVFALLSAILHPRRRLIEHIIYAFYFHAALLIPMAILIVAAVYAALPLPVGIALLALSVLSMNGAVALFDRGFYGSSWVGATVRSILICMGYATSAVFVSLGLIIVAAL
ncbi:MAG: DUF3667 domain-containing protein [Alphaproteobacteria bacterium]|nr:DUF3667 domain-containing protein [Alphaproteobacteria bacterium]